MTETERCAELIERLLADAELRWRFRRDPSSVLAEAGLPQLGAEVVAGQQSLLTLERRESRSSLAGMLVAAAAATVDLAEQVAPALAHDVDELIHTAGPRVHHEPTARHEPTAPAHQDPPSPAATSKAAPPHAAPPADPTPVRAPHPAPAPTADAPAHAAPPPAAPARSSAHPSAPPDQQDPPPARHEAPLARQDPGPARQDPGPPRREPPSVHHDPPSVHHDPPPARHDPPPTQRQPAAEHSPAAAPPAVLEPADPAPYPGDQAAPQALAAWMGAHAQRAGLPPELPVMAALTESGLRNLNYGDADSVGFFQMRLGIWDSGAYAGYPDDPQLQIQWFIDHALAARQQDPSLGQTPDTWGEWVADIEQPAAQFRYRYQLQLGAAQALLQGADLAPAVGAVAPLSAGEAALQAAMHLVGHPAPSATPGPGAIDSAGIIQYAFARQDIQLPPAAAEQFDVGMPVARQALRPGDAVFFAQTGGDLDRVGLYAGHGRVVTAGSDGSVRVTSLDDPALAPEYAGARRYTAQTLGDPRSYARPLPTIKRAKA